MSISVLNFSVRSIGNDLDLRVNFDGQIIYDRHPHESWDKISYEFDDEKETEHVVRFEMTGKTWEHTQFSPSGQIVNDHVIEIANVLLDNVELGYLFNLNTWYHHDFNGTGPPSIERFFGIMGCNGHAEFRFSSPLYLWLLENL